MIKPLSLNKFGITFKYNSNSGIIMAFDPVEDLKLALVGAINHNISLSPPVKLTVSDYKHQRAEYYRTLVKQNLLKIKSIAGNLDEAAKSKIIELEKFFNQGNPKAMLGIVGTLSIPKQMPAASLNLNLPLEIRDDIMLDMAEAERCLNAEAYRSSMVLCGRILETALHRKYYDVTGRDLLETSPGIGLGSILSKLKESNIEIDPAVAQQIHLINNVRIFSVHKKNTPFQPSKEQAQATMLFTIDILKKLF